MTAHRILYVSSGRTFGGAEQVMLSLATAFAKAGCDVRAIHHPGNTILADEIARRGLGGRAFPEIARRADASAFTELVREYAPDLVHIHRTWPLSDRHAGRGARKAGVRVIATEHVRIEEAGLRDRLAKRVLSRYDDHVIAVSNAVRRSLTGFWGVDPARVVTIPNGVDVAPFARPRVPASAGRHFSGHVPFRIGAIGRLERQKNMTALVDAFARARHAGLDAELCIVGEGSESALIRSAIESAGLGDRVKILKRIDDVPGFLAELDLFVLPSLWEG
ncbi:MAG: glycosyltransferase, partial [Gemmatimonadetes bacterium]|nr:glycosyltransferase [Gemmatimonadota bacterium]